jgi:hypothetical protein
MWPWREPDSRQRWYRGQANESEPVISVSGLLRRSADLCVQWCCVLALAGSTVVAETAGEGSRPVVPGPFPVGERLTYAVSWMGIRCGHMEISSFVETGADGEDVYRIVLFAWTTKFFDGLYKVRSRLDSFVDPERMSSFRYEEHALEKKKRKDEVWVLDHESGQAIRVKDGEETRIEIGADQAFDPLAFVYRLRSMNPQLGSDMNLHLMTDKGALETLARTTREKRVKTKAGRRDAVAVVPEPRDKMMFSKSGSMVVWIETEEPRRPCRIEFDLPFGKLVASLSGVEIADGSPVRPPWEAEEKR